MPISHAFVLGLVQGLSEFLPISSSGHLLLVPWLFGWDDFDDESTKKAFDVALHIGTLGAAIVYFRNDLARYVRAGLGSLGRRGEPMSTDARVAWLLLASTVPAALVGAVFEEWIDEQLGTPLIIAISLIVFGLLLGVADRATGTRVVERYADGATPSSSGAPRRWRSTRGRPARGSRSRPPGSRASVVMPRPGSAS